MSATQQSLEVAQHENLDPISATGQFTADQLIDLIVGCDDRWKRSDIALVLRMRIACDEFKASTAFITRKSS